MKTASIVVFRLAAFLTAVGLVYAVTSHELAGGSLILVAAVCFAYVGWILRAAVRGAEPAVEAQDRKEEPADEAEHVGPTIWPFGFSLAAIGFVLGIVVFRWLLGVGVALFVASAAGWVMDVRRQHAPGHGS
jgi:Cytochrome c oxidase subunit IV